MQTPLFLFLGDLGGGEIMLIMVVILIFFGANKIPELARGLGKGIREFKDASSEIRNEFENAGRTTPQQPQAPYNPTPAYQAPVQPVAPVSAENSVVSDAQVVPATPLAPPMDGGITPPVTERPRLDQTTNE
ncbi:Sec-independent protein translocase subunit TatA/TatB [Hymenobacter persicinus]|uniref:Sec-independent protein translocase protein TatA n=1 Tax=Hymenobacter persicinus TaxID=2025506 RepID=A0A4Q5LC86_9BACT|nr:twin-arginine translocase TatA/TatE family subunit [Hymenobacter persicinus]RYU78831.1 twin-arginine translocase TatA/TatE family subunit [Hymenobacter persicinus]